MKAEVTQAAEGLERSIERYRSLLSALAEGTTELKNTVERWESTTSTDDAPFHPNETKDDR